jgi:hypothetical protein
MGDELTDGATSLGTPRRRYSVMISRKERSTVFSHDAEGA